MKQLDDIRITLENVNEELPKLLHIVRPSWNKDKIEIKKVSGGYSNNMYHCFDQDDPASGLMVRAKNDNDLNVPEIIDRAIELKVVQALHANGHFPEIVATFANGFCYKFIKGKPIYGLGQKNFILKEPVVRLMARKLAELHSVKVEGCDYSKPEYFEPAYFALKEMYPTADQLPPGAPTRDELHREMKLIDEFISKTDCPTVICHGDPHPGNIVLDAETETVTYVDWEGARISHQAADLGGALQILSTLDIEVPENCSRKYLRYYLEKWFEIQGRDESSVTEEDVDKLEKKANIFRLATQLLWVTFMMLFFGKSKPKHLSHEDMKTLQQAFRGDESDADGKVKASATSEEIGEQMCTKIYKNYLLTKDEILAKS